MSGFTGRFQRYVFHRKFAPVFPHEIMDQGLKSSLRAKFLIPHSELKGGNEVATTYNNLYLDTRARLKKAGIEAAQLEARELICYASDKSREQLYRDMPMYVS